MSECAELNKAGLSLEYRAAMIRAGVTPPGGINDSDIEFADLGPISSAKKRAMIKRWESLPRVKSTSTKSALTANMYDISKARKCKRCGGTPKYDNTLSHGKYMVCLKCSKCNQESLTFQQKSTADADRKDAMRRAFVDWNLINRKDYSKK